MCQVADRPEAKVNLQVSPENLELVVKAVKSSVERGEFATETVNDFKLQNPAAKHLFDFIDDSYDIMVESLVKEVGKLLANGK